MEVAGLSIGAIGLASLFSTCLECFEYFQIAKSFQSDFEILLLKLDCQRERLLTWGEIVGISKIEAKERNSDLDSTKHELIQRALTSIVTLFTETEKLQKEFGVQSVEAPENVEYRLERITSSRMHWFRKSYQRLTAHSIAQKQSGILLKTKWAIRDKTKFETLINHIKEIVSDLHDILPIPARSQEEMIYKDIALMSLPGLRRVKKACSEEYQTWSDVASAIVMASEAGTIDHRSVGEWLQDTSTMGFDTSETMANTSTTAKSTVLEKGFEITVSHRTKFYFVFTSHCFLKDSDIGCDQNTLGFRSLKLHGETFLPGPNTTISKEEVLGKRITKFMNVTFSNEDLEMLRWNNFELGDWQSAALEANLPLGNQGGSKYLIYRTRVDDRVSASCCPEPTKINRLVSLLNMVKTIEAADRSQTTGFSTAWIDFIDRVWIEQRVYQLEEDLYAQNAPRSVIHGGDELFAELQSEDKETGIVILGELDQCLWMLQTPPFPWKARIPKETEIYQLAKSRHGSAWKRTYLGTYTPRGFESYQTGNLPVWDQPRPANANGSVVTRWDPEPPAFQSLESQESTGNGEKGSRQRPQPSSEIAPPAPPMNKKDRFHPPF